MKALIFDRNFILLMKVSKKQKNNGVLEMDRPGTESLVDYQCDTWLVT